MNNISNNNHIKFNKYDNCTDITIPNSVVVPNDSLDEKFYRMRNVININIGGGGIR